MNASAFLGSRSLTAHSCCERLYIGLRRSTRGRRLHQRISAVGWDPEGILAAPKGGHISRRTFQKQLAEDQTLAEQVEREREIARQELEARRDARVQPSSHGELIEYLLSTEQPEMEYETARCRPLITQDFLAFLQQEIGAERFKPSVNEGRVSELEFLQQYLKDALAKLDSQIEGKVAPLERMKRLLTAPDKKATLLEMAGNNEIDNGLLDLLQENIDAAKAAGQPEPAQFMEKVRDAAKKFVMS
ncbi:g5153 [Coccomyxa viridis]|uniref:G5153 protein n=1 Tax=Coccomyxa viridis TaxID=1274662 RepID=A0ABP1FTJ3_9CHLO